MREWCSCGAAFHTLSNKRMNTWRINHRHDAHEEREPDKEGAFASTERRGELDFETPVYTARIGFQPNGYSERSQQLASILREKAQKNLGR